MASFKFSMVSEFNSDQSSDHGLIFERMLHVVRKIGAVRCFSFHVDCGRNKPSKAIVARNFFPSLTGYVQIRVGHNNHRFSQLKHIQVTGFEWSDVSMCAHELVDQIDDGVKLLEGPSQVEDLDSKNTNCNFVGNQEPPPRSLRRESGRKLFGRSPRAKRAFGRNVLRPSIITKQSCIDKRNNRNSFSKADATTDAALSSIGPHSAVEDCNVVLVQLERSSDEKALTFFKWMKDNGKLKENLNAYNLALRVLSRKEDWDSAELVLQHMTVDSGCKLSVQVFNTLIYVCCKRGLSDWGTKWFRMMLNNGVQPNVATIGMLMKLYQKRGNLAEAEFTFDHMRNNKLYCAAAYSSMITIYSRLGLYDKSEGIINAMEEDNVLPNVENWLVRLNVYNQQGKLEKAESILKSMQEEEITPNIVAYNMMITGYGKVGDMTAVKCLFENLKNVGVQPDESTYRSMIEGFGRANDYLEALKYYKELKDLGFRPNSSNFYTMINLQAKHKDEEGAVQTLKDMRAMGCQYSSIISSLLLAYERVERVDKVPIILRDSFYQKLLLDQTSCSILVTAYVKNCMLDDALQVLKEKEWEDPVFEDNLCHLLISSCKDAGHLENAVKIFTQMCKSATILNLHITSTMIDIFSTMNRFSDAEDLFLKLKASGITLDVIAYSVVVRMYVKAGSLKDACLVLDMIEKQKDIVPDQYLFFDMLRIYQRCGLHEKLTEVYYKILRSGITWDDEMYNCVINCCGHALPVDELSRLFNEILGRRMKTSSTTFNVMLNVYGKAKLFKKVRKVLWIARKWGLADAVSFNTIIAAYGQSKDFKKMRSTFRHMQFARYPVTPEACNSMLDAYGKDDQLREFREVLLKMKEAQCAYDYYTYNILLNIYGKKGWLENVICVLHDLRDCGLKPDLVSYNTLIQAYGNMGMVEEAVNVIKEMREAGIEPDRITYINLVVALQKNDKILEAVKWSLWMKQIGMSKCEMLIPGK